MTGVIAASATGLLLLGSLQRVLLAFCCWGVIAACATGHVLLGLLQRVRPAFYCWSLITLTFWSVEGFPCRISRFNNNKKAPAGGLTGPEINQQLIKGPHAPSPFPPPPLFFSFFFFFFFSLPEFDGRRRK